MPNPHITIESPFPRSEMPALHVWSRRIWASVADENTPTDLEEWMAFQQRRQKAPELKTWGLYRNGDLGGYFEAVAVANPESLSGDVFVCSELRDFAVGACIFKKEMWGHDNTVPALSLVFLELFGADEIGMMFFPVARGNRPLMKLYTAVGVRPIGDINEGQRELWGLTAEEWKRNQKEIVSGNGKPSIHAEAAAAVGEGVQSALVRS
jgi:hypothetical protein